MLGAGWAVADVACVCGVVRLGVGGAQWLVCFLFYFFAVLVFSGACPLRVVLCVRALADCDRVRVVGCRRVRMPCGAAVRAMAGRPWLLAVTTSLSFSGRLLFRLSSGC